MGVPEGSQKGPKRPKTAFLGHKQIWWLQTDGTVWNKGGSSQGTSPVMHWNRFWGQECHLGAPIGPQKGPKLEPPDPLMAQKGCFWPFWTSLEAPWHTHMALPDPQNCPNSSLWMCRDLFHPCFTLFHQFGATRLAYGPKRPILVVLDPVWPYIWPKWLEQECSPLEQVNPYQNEAENIMGCHGKPTSKNP